MIIIGLGANLDSRFGTPPETMRAAVLALSDVGLRIIKTSSLWASAPMYVRDQPWFHNAVLAVETDLSPYALLEKLHDIENVFGRVRVVKNGARVIDLDLEIYDDEIMNDPALILPHPRMAERGFVLKPMAEIMPKDWRHPITDQSLAQMIENLPDVPDQEIHRSEEAFP